MKFNNKVRGNRFHALTRRCWRPLAKTSCSFTAQIFTNLCPILPKISPKTAVKMMVEALEEVLVGGKGAASPEPSAERLSNDLRRILPAFTLS